MSCTRRNIALLGSCWSAICITRISSFIIHGRSTLGLLLTNNGPTTQWSLASGKGFGAANTTRVGDQDDPQLLYYHQQAAASAAAAAKFKTEDNVGSYLRFNQKPAGNMQNSVSSVKSSNLPAGMRVFDRVLDFPCIFDVKVIGEPSQGDSKGFAEDMVSLVGEVVGKPSEEIEFSTRDTSSGKYRSLTIRAPVENADQLYEIYERVATDPRVKFKF